MQPFGDLPQEYCNRENSRFVLVPVPFDGTSTWIKGADRGPAAIIEASAQLELYDIETGSEVCRKGIHTDRPVACGPSPESMVASVEEVVREWIGKEKLVGCIGGEHSISVGAVNAHLGKYPEMSVLQLDAHTDLRPEYEGSPYNHACTMARIRELCPVTQVGIRSMDSSEKEFLEPGRVFFQQEIRQEEDWMDRVTGTLNKQVYLTLDLDVLDPSIMPSTGTPEPGGMGWYELITLLRKVASERQIVGFDVVELCPNPSVRAPDFLAAKLIYKILTYCNEQ